MTRLALAAALVAVAGCDRGVEPAAVIAASETSPDAGAPIDALPPPPPDAAAEVDAMPAAASLPAVRFATTVDLEAVRFYEATPEAITRLGTVRLPRDYYVVAAAWRTPDELYVTDSDAVVYAVTIDGVTRVPVPPTSAWKTSRPDRDSERGDRAESLIVDAAGAVWLGRCMWGWGGEGWTCTRTVHVRLGDQPVQTLTAPVATGWPEPAIAAPPDREVVVGRRVGAGHDDLPPMYALTCKGPRGTVATTRRLVDDGAAAGAVRWMWLPGDPAWLAVEVGAESGDCSEESFTAWYVAPGCEPPEAYESVTLSFGPPGLWARTTNDGQTVVHGPKGALIRLRDESSLGFAPAWQAMQ